MESENRHTPIREGDHPSNTCISIFDSQIGRERTRTQEQERETGTIPAAHIHVLKNENAP